MQNANKKTAAAIIIALFLTTSIGASMLLTDAHTPPWALVTHAFVQAMPDTTGVGQSAYVYMWIDFVFPGAAKENNYRWHNYNLTITDPNGNVTTRIFETVLDSTSNQGYSFTPDVVGIYKLEFHFPGQNYTQYNYSNSSAFVGDYALPSNATNYLTVTEEPIFEYPSSYPLPTEYWTRPIYGENVDWRTISSNWLGVGAPGYGGNAGGLYTGSTFFKLPTDSVGPLTSHIMWTKPIQDGGLVGGDNLDPNFASGGNTFFSGSAYNQRFVNPIIVNGKIIYNAQSGYSASRYHTYVTDLRTGEILIDDPRAITFSFAYIPDLENLNQHGVSQPLLATNNFAQVYDTNLVNLWNVTGVPSSSSTANWAVMGPNGEFMKYILNTTSISQWNSTKMWRITASSLTPGYPSGIQGVNDTTCDYYGIPLTYQGNNFTSAGNPSIVGAILGDLLVARNGTMPTTGASAFIGATPIFNQYTYFAVNLNASRGAIGNVMWIKNVAPQVDKTGSNATVLSLGIDKVNRVFFEGFRETNQFIGYSMLTGEKLWGPTAGQGAIDYYGSQSSGTVSNSFAFGYMYVAQMDGIVYAYDTATGELKWTYGNGGEGNSTQSGNAVPGRYPTFVAAFGNSYGENQVVYTITSEHTIQTPIYKGAMARALNASTGEEIWKLSSYTTEFSTNSYAIADGYAVWFNDIDGRIYSVGQGPSQTTVSAPQVGIELGRSLVISGSVYDVSAGSKGDEQIARFPSGLPVASDAAMTDWMGYVYQQKPLPADFTGVVVTINVIDANNNFRTIGTATTDPSGTYSLDWQPDIEGKYTVIANFAGTNAYWPSSAKTAFTVDQVAATLAPTQTISEQSMADLYFVPAIAGLFIVLIIAIVLIVLVLRKRP